MTFADSLTLTPAYGRDYKSKAEVLKAWNDDKDFMAHSYNGRDGYINRAQAVQEGVKHVTFRYKRMTMAFSHNMK